MSMFNACMLKRERVVEDCRGSRTVGLSQREHSALSTTEAQTGGGRGRGYVYNRKNVHQLQ